MHIRTEIWTHSDNMDDCGDPGVSVVVAGASEAMLAALERRIKDTQRWHEADLIAERDWQAGAVLRLHCVPFYDDLDDPEEWPDGDAAIKHLLFHVRTVARAFGATVDFD